jgi:PAS domain S-box-containing protein
VVVFAVYAAAGQVQDSPPAVIGALTFLVGAMLFAEFQLRRAGNDEERLLRAWAVILPIDIAVIMLAASLDRNDFSPIPTLSIATIFTAAAMFRTRYVMGLTAAAAVLTIGAHVPHEALDGRVTFWSQIFAAAVIAGAGGFAAVRGRSEEQLRRRLTTSEERERAQASALREALESARLSEARFEALSRHAPAVIALYDRNGVPTFASTYLAREFGIGPDRLIGGGLWRERIPADDLDRVIADVARAIEGQAVTDEFTMRNARGEPRRMAGVFFPVEDGAAAIMQDVTLERSFAAQVARAQHMETLGTLAGGVAHDFNNLLTAILGNIYLAERELPKQSSAHQLLEDARVAGQRGADLVRRLLEYSRPGIENPGPVFVCHLIDETVRLAGRGLTPQIDVAIGDCDPEATVMGSFGALQQVLLNLLVNGRDAMEGGGRLTVTWKRVCVDDEYCGTHVGAHPGTYHAISVADTGSGIPSSMLGRIFDPFFTTKDVGKGTGLGLSTAQGIIGAHSGWIEVDSRPGAGSTFRVFLPVA